MRIGFGNSLNHERWEGKQSSLVHSQDADQPDIATSSIQLLLTTARLEGFHDGTKVDILVPEVYDFCTTSAFRIC